MPQPQQNNPLGHLKILNPGDVLEDAVACVVPDVGARVGAQSYQPKRPQDGNRRFGSGLL
jgi:hypothetical protein